jgi:(2Fe-2S) ferredoxin
MPPPYTRHVFVCTNRRPEGSPRGCCATKGGDDVRLALKRAVDAAGVSNVRVNASGCLDACERGVAVVVYPEGTWYGGVGVTDVAEVAESLKPGAAPVERLRMQPIEKRNA